jgi:GNAT superfamily N-acetyltransferase
MRAVREAVWRSSAYQRARQVAERLTRPLRRLDLAAIVRYDLERALVPATTNVRFEAFVASRQEVNEEVVQKDDPQARGIFDRWLAEGALCFVARVEGRLAAYNWTRYEPTEDGGYYIDLGPDEIQCLSAYTFSEFRGQNLHAALLREMLLFNAGLGYRRAYSKVSLTNRRSPKAHRRLGWDRTGVILTVRGIRGFPVVRLSGSAHPWRRLRRADR